MEALRADPLAPADAEADLQAIDAAFGAWAERDLDGEAYVEQLRSGGRVDEAAAR